MTDPATPARVWPAPGTMPPSPTDFPSTAARDPAPGPGDAPKAHPQPTPPTFSKKERKLPFTVPPAIRVTLESTSIWYKNSATMIDSPESLAAALGRVQALTVALRCKTLPVELADDASLELDVVAAKVSKYRKLHRC